MSSLNILKPSNYSSDIMEKPKGSPMVKVVNFILHKVFRRKKPGSIDSPCSGEGSYLSYSEVDLESLSSAVRRTQEMLGRPLTPPLKPPRHIVRDEDEFCTPTSSARFDFSSSQVSERTQTKDAAVEACERDIDHCLEQDDNYSVTYGNEEFQLTPQRVTPRSTRKTPPQSSKSVQNLPVDNVEETRRPRHALSRHPWGPSPERTTNGKAPKRPTSHRDVRLTPCVKKSVAGLTKEIGVLKERDCFTGSALPADHRVESMKHSRCVPERAASVPKLLCQPIDRTAHTTSAKLDGNGAFVPVDETVDPQSNRLVGFGRWSCTPRDVSEPTSSWRTSRGLEGFQRRASVNAVVTTIPRSNRTHDTSLDSLSRRPATCPGTGKASTTRSGRRLVKVEHRPPTPYSMSHLETAYQDAAPSKLCRTNGQTSLVQGKSPKDRGDGSSPFLKTSPFSRFRHSSYSGVMMACGDESVLSRARLPRVQDL
ncbi:uncharacterized protein LOC135366060 [Ornithodoros turicata]|uniref:uncharacterized protein LOC135366060 n=1 Tax=Ornithodoros turicata TaxID=34597 RepID=UPI0031393A7F